MNRSDVPPHSPEAERAVLGLLLVDGGEVFPRLSGVLKATDFYLTRHRVLWRTCLTLASQGLPLDEVTVVSELRRTGELEDAGGFSHLATCIAEAAIPARLDAYAEVIRSHSLERAMIGLSGLLTGVNGTGPGPALQHIRAEIEALEARLAVSDTPALFPVMTSAELLALDIPAPTFHVAPLIPAGAITFIVGESEAYKSWFTLHLALCIATGRPVLDRFPVKQGPVLIISEENGLLEDKRRIALLYQGLGISPVGVPLHIASDTLFSFDDERRYQAMRAFCAKHGIVLVIGDSFIRLHRRKEERADEMNALYMDRLKPLIAAGTDLGLLHHKRKAQPNAPTSDNDDIRGSGDIRAFADSVLFLRPTSDGKVLLRHNKARRSVKQDPFVFTVTNLDTGGVAFGFEGNAVDVLDKTSACKEAATMFALTMGTFSRKQAVAELHGKQKFPTKVVTTVLTELSKLDYPLKKYKVQREDFYTYLTEPGGDEGEDSLG